MVSAHHDHSESPWGPSNGTNPLTGASMNLRYLERILAFEEKYLRGVPEGHIVLPRSYNDPAGKESSYIVLKKPDALILDFDGVQVNEPHFHEEVVQGFLRKFGVAVEISDLLSHGGNQEALWHYAIDLVRERVGVTDEVEVVKDQLRAIERELTHKRDAPIIRPDTLKLAQGEFYTVLATNRESKDALTALDKLGFLEFYHAIFAFEEPWRRKPEADMLVQAIEELNLEGKSIMMVGDSASDLGPLRKNVLAQGVKVEILLAGVLPPGRGRDRDREQVLFDAEANLVVPSLDHLIRDLLVSTALKAGDRKLAAAYYELLKDAIKARTPASELIIAN